MYSAYKLNNQGDNKQPWRTPFPIWNQSVVPCPVLTVASDLHIGFSRGRSGGLVFPSLSEFSTVYCDPHSLRLWSHYFMANRWGNSGNSDRLYFGDFQNCHRWWLQPWNVKMLALGRKVMTNLDSILKSRDITLPTKICLVKAMVFPVVCMRVWL